MQDTDYLKRRSVNEFLEWIEATNASIMGTELSTAFRARAGLWKKYADEASPLGRYLRENLEVPRVAEVALFIDTDLPDATITVGEAVKTYEITTTDHPGAVHSRVQLNKYGVGPGETNTVQTGKDLATRKAAGDPRDFGVVMNRDVMTIAELDRIVERLKKKCSKTYPTGTILIVDSCSTSLEHLELDEVKAYLQPWLGTPPFLEIWIGVFPGRTFRLS